MQLGKGGMPGSGNRGMWPLPGVTEGPARGKARKNLSREASNSAKLLSWSPNSSFSYPSGSEETVNLPPSCNYTTRASLKILSPKLMSPFLLLFYLSQQPQSFLGFLLKTLRSQESFPTNTIVAQAKHGTYGWASGRGQISQERWRAAHAFIRLDVSQ